MGIVLSCCCQVLKLLQVKVKLNLHAIVGIESVQQVEEEEFEETIIKPASNVKVCLLLPPLTVHDAPSACPAEVPICPPAKESSALPACTVRGPGVKAHTALASSLPHRSAP